MAVTQYKKGFTLLITLLLMTVLLGVSGSLLSIVLRQYQLSGISQTSEMAFQAANAGMECALYNDYKDYPNSAFDVPGNGGDQSAVVSIACMDSAPVADGSGTVKSGEAQVFQFDWGDPALCTKITVYKFYSTSVDQDMIVPLGYTQSCPQGSPCTVIKSRGYNNACDHLNNPRTVERELIRMY